MRCPDCSKFVSMDNGDPDENSIEVTLSGSSFEIEASYRHTRNCADCGTELKEYEFNPTGSVDFEDMDKLKKVDGSELTADEKATLEAAIDDGTAECEIESTSTSVDEAGGGRYKKNMLTLTVDYLLTITAGEIQVEYTGQITEETNAGSYDECC